ncbi:ABC transporter permease [Mangrovimonas sp. YM274]|uniref:ABC transporter permease n=1 Tax=Mangrovimonas sp. YM274 TaxID=3070660 RepID=UPI0027DE53A3|nr:ABC transporter permease [Mangrovimonas sp. YM274]WMI69835.1 ABC transporter permease [Mangrovimonas sp. YM274]
METRIYQRKRKIKPGKLLKESLKDVVSSRFLSKQLAVRDIKALYRQSFLGVFWAFITPIMTALVWILLRQSGTVTLSETGVPYPIFVFSGTLIWSILVEAINAPMANTNAARGILTKINFPKEALVVSGIYKLLFNSTIKIGVLLLFLQVYGLTFTWHMLLFPLAVLGAVVFGTALGLLITPLGLLYKDIGKIVAFGMQFLMYATPVVYAIPKEGIMRMLMEVNPLTPLITVPRDLLLGGMPQYMGYFGAVIVGCMPLLFIGLVFYRMAIPVIVERLSA